MRFFGRKVNPRRSQVRRNIATDRFSQIGQMLNANIVSLVFLWLVFIACCVFILSFEINRETSYIKVLFVTVVVALISLAGAFYIYHYQRRIMTNRTRTMALAGLIVVLLATAKIGMLLTEHTWWATGTAVTAAIILTIAYMPRFAMGMALIYCVLVAFTTGTSPDLRLFLTMAAGVVTCCFSLGEIRTRMKLLKVSTLAAVMVFLMSVSLASMSGGAQLSPILSNAGMHAGITLVVGMLIQSLLPLIEKVFRIATSMTLLDFSDANQPLLRRLAMEAPGTFSHSLLIGSIAEAAAEGIGRNGLLCRVGAYYHDIGKINKPGYFVENEVGSTSRHKELSAAMSQLVIVGHVKDGIEMAKEYGLPAVLRQFIETHHGTTLVEYFYNEAIKRYEQEQSEAGNGKKSAQRPSESEFRYPGPKPRTKEAAIVMLADSVEGAVRSLNEVTPTRIEAVVHNMSMKRLQDGQFDECDLSLRELSRIEAGISKALAAHYHSRIAYPKRPDIPEDSHLQKENDTNTPPSKQSQPQQERVERKN